MPDRLPHPETDLIWNVILPSTGVGGLMVAGDAVIVSGRDAADAGDVFFALDLATGRRRWKHQYEASASLDYGNSPRATPAVSDGVLVTLGATGVVCGLDAMTGVPLWKVNFAEQFQAELPTWGFSGSPLIIGGSVLLQIAANPSLAALDLFTGEVKWRVDGESAGYASLMPLNGNQQVAGVTSEGYFVRNVEDGTLVWSAKPEYSGDFGVPSPVVLSDGIVFTSENNGVQLFSTAERGLDTRPSSINEFLIPDTHTPVLVGDQLLVAHDGLYSLSIDNSLTESWKVAESVFSGYASVIASQRRALVTCNTGELLLVDIATEAKPMVLDQRRLTQEKVTVLSDPAVHGARLLIRVGREIRCYRLR